jgi:hypothetical protein
MIVTQHLQIALDFQNNFVDYGRAGIEWENFVGTFGFKDAFFGRGLDVPTSGTLPKLRSTTLLTDPCNIGSSGEYTIAFRINKVNASQGSRFFSGGGRASPNQGTVIQLQNNGTIRLNIENDITSIEIGLGRKLILVKKFTNKFECYIYDYDGGALLQETINVTRTINWTNRYWRINNISYGVETSLASDLYGLDTIDAFYLWNTVITETDTKRLFHNLHPLNG